MIAKIERAEAIPALQSILDASDGIMVARGDLAVEVGNAAVPALQKRMIRMGLANARDDFPLSRLIHLGHEVIASLGGNGQGVRPVQAANDDFAGTAGGTNGNIEKWLHGK